MFLLSGFSLAIAVRDERWSSGVGGERCCCGRRPRGSATGFIANPRHRKISGLGDTVPSVDAPLAVPAGCFAAAFGSADGAGPASMGALAFQKTGVLFNAVFSLETC